MNAVAAHKVGGASSRKVLTAVSISVISILLITSAVLKLKSPNVLASWIHATFLWDIPSYMSYALGVTEILAVLAILSTKWRAIGFYLSSALSSGFLGVSIARLVFDLKGNCGCYGAFAMSPAIQVGVAALIYLLSIVNLLQIRKP